MTTDVTPCIYCDAPIQFTLEPSGWNMTTHQCQWGDEPFYQALTDEQKTARFQAQRLFLNRLQGAVTDANN